MHGHERRSADPRGRDLRWNDVCGRTPTWDRPPNPRAGGRRPCIHPDMNPRLHKRLGAALLVLGALAGVGPGAAAAAPPSYNLLGTWSTGYLEGSTRLAANGNYQFTTMDMASGAFSGTAEVTGTKFTAEGVESG